MGRCKVFSGTLHTIYNLSFNSAIYLPHSMAELNGLGNSVWLLFVLGDWEGCSQLPTALGDVSSTKCS